MATYKKPSRKVEEKYLKSKAKEIPLYDPQTGEPNLEYEKITGKKNPLLNAMETPPPKKGAETLSKSIREKMDLIPHDLEYKRRNRFLVHFPKEMGISHLQIESTTLPISEIKKQWVGFSRTEISDVVVVVRETEENLVIKNVINRMEEKFDFVIEMVNGQNVVMNKWIMKGCFISQIANNSLSYKADGVLTTILTIKINELQIV